MSTPSRTYLPTKTEHVYFRVSAKRDPNTGKPDRIYSFWYRDETGKGQFKTVGRHSKGVRPATAYKARHEFLDTLEKGESIPHIPSITVGQVVEVYSEWQNNEGKHIDRPLQQYNMHMRCRFHMVPIASITPGMLSKIRAELRKTPAVLKAPKAPADDYIPPPLRTLSDQTIHHLFSFLRAAVYHAIATNLWHGQNPFASKRNSAWSLPKVKNHRNRYFTPKEAFEILNQLKLRSYVVFVMAYFSLKHGIRATELMSLRAHDIDTSARIIHITAKGGMIQPISVSQEIIDLLQSLDRIGTQYVFSFSEDGLQKVKRIPSVFGRIVKDMGLNPPNISTTLRVTFHTFRHTFASWLAQSGKVTLQEIKDLMRHESIEMTLKYAHLIPGKQQQKTAIIDEVLSSQSG